MSFQVVDGDERQAARERQRLGIGDANQQRTRQTRAGSHGNGIQIRERDAGLGQCGAHHRNDGAQMLAAGQFGDHSAVVRVG